MGRRTTIILNDKLFTKLLKIQTEKILERNAAVSISSLINDIIEEKIQEGVKKPSVRTNNHDVILEKITKWKTMIILPSRFTIMMILANT